MISSFQDVVHTLVYLGKKGEESMKLEWLHFIIMCCFNCLLEQDVGF